MQKISIMSYISLILGFILVVSATHTLYHIKRDKRLARKYDKHNLLKKSCIIIEPINTIIFAIFSSIYFFTRFSDITIANMSLYTDIYFFSLLIFGLLSLMRNKLASEVRNDNQSKYTR